MARPRFFVSLALVTPFLCLASSRAQNATIPSPTVAAGEYLPLEAPAAGAPGHQPVEAPAASISPQVAALVEQLGNDSYVVRQAASAKLAALGLPVKPALLAALKHDDPEVRLRARHLLGAIQAADLEARLKAFLADVRGEKTYDLPCWDQFRKLAGDNEAARKLFVEMQRTEAALLETGANGGDVAAESLQIRCFHWQRELQLGYSTGRPQPPPFAAVAALLLIAGDERTKTPDNIHMQLYNFVQQQPFQQAVNDVAQADRAKRLLGSWVRGLTGPTTSQYGIQLAMQWNLPEGLTLARKVSENKTGSPYIRAQAIATLAKLGDKTDLSMLQGLLTDGGVCARRITMVDGKRVEQNTEIRDVALAGLVYLTAQKFDEYGFKDLRPAPPNAFHYSQVFFPSPAARDTAIKKWQEWASKNVKVETTKGTSGNSPDKKPAGEKTVEPAKEKKAAGGLGAVAPAIAPAGIMLAGKGFMVVGDASQASPTASVDDLPFYLADREAGLNLQRSRQMIEEGQYATALRALDAILAHSESRSYQPEIGRPLYLSLRLEAQRILGQLPQDGRKAYELLVGHNARRALDEAVSAGDVAQLEGVARRYVAAAAGQEAALVWGEHLLDTGRPLAAAMVLADLRESGAQRRFEPLLSLRIAHAWLAAGMPQQARDSLLQVKSPSSAEIEIAGQRLASLDNVDGLLSALVRIVAVEPRRVPQAGEWLVVRGNAERNDAQLNDAQSNDTSHAAGNAPWLRRRWHVEPAATPAVRDAIRAIDVAYRQERLSVLPTGHPLAVSDVAAGELVLARTTGELLALAGDSGEVRWRVPLMDALDDAMAAAASPAANTALATNAAALIRGTDERVWNDLTYGTLASDGRSVFLVEDVGVAQGLSLRGASGERMVVQPDGSRRLNSGWPGESNRLTAYDVRTGKFRWEIGGPRGQFQLDLAGAYFLGPPLPLLGKLHVMAEWEQRICLLTLEAATGKLLQRMPLAIVDSAENAMRPFFGMGTMPPPAGRPSRRLSGASPAFAQGVMVCPTSWNSFAGVDVGAGEMRWSYRPMRLEEAAVNMNAFMFGMPQNRNSADDALRRDDRWADCAPTIAGQRVLITPRDSEKLLCLDLRSGRLVWEAPRGDSQFVAGVAGDVALLVGRSSLRGLKMSDGAPAWERLPLPAGAAPSGRGVFSPGRYVQPLSSAEVAVIDVASGRWLHRCRSVDGRVPGNLVRAKDHFISQGPDGIESFPCLESVLVAAASAVAARPNDAVALADWGRMLLAQGNHAEAIAQLRRSLELRRDDATRAALCDAVLQALEINFTAHRTTASELAAVFPEAQREAAYQRAMAIGLLRSGHRLEAFDALVALGRSEGKIGDLEPVDAARFTRRDVWRAGQLAELLAACTPSERAELDRRIAEQMAKAIASGDPATLREFISQFGEHPQGARAREELLSRQFNTGTTAASKPKLRPLDVERLLLGMQAAGDAVRSRTATARLARLMLAQDRFEEAAGLFRRLGAESADAVCLDGKTGRQLLDELPANSPVRQAMSAASAWPPGLVEKQTAPGTASNVARNSWPLQVETARNHVLAGLSLEITSNVMPQKVVARDHNGAERWSVELKPREAMTFSPQAVRARLDGHLLLAWQGNHLFALDTLAAETKRPEQLWTKDLTAKFPGQEGNATQHVVFFGGGAGGPVFATTDAYGRPVAEVGPVTAQYVCYQRLRMVTAVDALSGDALWSRHDLPQRCELLGDDEVVLAAPRDGELSREGATATVLAARDGRELGRCELPDKRDRLAVYGRHIVTWSGGDTGHTLRLLDPWKKRDVWRRDFPAGSKLSRIGLDEAAVLDAQGNLLILSLPDGAPRVRATIPAPAHVLDIQVLRSPDRYLLLAKQSLPAAAAAADKPVEKMVYPLSLGGQVEMVSGTLWGFDPRTGEPLWQTTLDQRGMDLSQSPHWPILVLAERVYHQQPNAAQRNQVRITCVDKRDGRVVFEESGSQAISQLLVVPDAASHSVELRTGRANTKLVFTGQPWPAK